MHNFLSAEAEEFRAGVQVRFGRASDQFSTLSKSASEQLAALSFDGRSPAERVAIAFWSKCVRACQAAFLLAERGMVADAQATLRGALETLFHAVALVHKPDILDRLREHDDKEKRKQVDQMLKHADIRAALSDRDTARLKPLSELEGKSSFSVWDAADAAKMTHLYESLYRTLSQNAAHSTLTSLNHELLTRAEGGPKLRFGPSEDGLEWTIDLISECLAAGVHVMQTLSTRHTI